MVLQAVLSLMLALVFVHYRPRLEQVEHWRFLAKRPIAAGLLVGFLSGLVFYESLPDMVRLALNVLIGMAFVRRLGGLVAGSWRWQFMYGLLSLSIMTNLCYVLGVPLALLQSAKIAKIGLRSTTVRTADQADVIVPNTDLITNRVTNWTLTNRQARSVIPVGVAYGSDIALVMQTLQECALAHPGVLQNPEPLVLFRSFGDSSLDFELYAWVAALDTRGQVASDLRQDIDRRFRQTGIEMPFPQRDLHVRSVENTNTMAAIVRAPLD